MTTTTTTTTTTEQLADIAEQLRAVDLGETTGHVRQRINDALSVRYELPRGTIVARDEYAEGSPPVLYVETSHDSRTDALHGVTVTVYAIAHRGDKRTSGAVEVHWNIHPNHDGETVRAYWRSLTGSAMPDGARHLIAAAVLGEVTAVMTPELWQILADETDAAKHSANVSRYVDEAVRAIDNARRALGETVSFR